MVLQLICAIDLYLYRCACVSSKATGSPGVSHVMLITPLSVTIMLWARKLRSSARTEEEHVRYLVQIAWTVFTVVLEKKFTTVTENYLKSPD